MMPAPGATCLTLAAVSVAFAGRLALERVSLEVGAGEIVAIIGPNGAGKTTLLRTALGLVRPSAGEVALRARRVGYVPQRLAIDETLPLTVRRFLALAPDARGDARAALAEVGAGHALELPIQTLSGGETQRVLLARALIRAPDLLVLDEPAQGVDLAGQAELSGLIRRVRERQGCAVLLVAHDLHLVMSTADRVLCLDRTVRCAGTPDAVRGDPAYRALFPAAAEPRQRATGEALT